MLLERLCERVMVEWRGAGRRSGERVSERSTTRASRRSIERWGACSMGSGSAASSTVRWSS